MFEQSMVTVRGRRPWTYSLSTGLQVALVGGALLVPLLKIEALPAVKLEACVCHYPKQRVTLVDAKTMRSSQPPRAGAVVMMARAPVRPFTAPRSIPQGVAQLFDEPGLIDIPTGGGSGVPTGPPGSGIPGGWSDGSLRVAEPVKPRPAEQVAEPVKPRIVTIGGQVRPPKLIHEVRPAYPPLARQARVSGTVKLAAVIAIDGSVQALRAVSGHPLLVNAALEAVREWRYEPTLLNGRPVEVAFTVDVNFGLTQ